MTEKKIMNLNVVPRYGDHYEWNKVVTCIHNVLSQQRYLEHYGEVTIRNLKSSACTCRITFVKVRDATSCSAQSRFVLEGFFFSRLTSLYFVEVSLLGLGHEQERGAGDGTGPKWERHPPVRRPVA